MEHGHEALLTDLAAARQDRQRQGRCGAHDPDREAAELAQRERLRRRGGLSRRRLLDDLLSHGLREIQHLTALRQLPDESVGKIYQIRRFWNRSIGAFISLHATFAVLSSSANCAAFGARPARLRERRGGCDDGSKLPCDRARGRRGHPHALVEGKSAARGRRSVAARACARGNCRGRRDLGRGRHRSGAGHGCRRGETRLAGCRDFHAA